MSRLATRQFGRIAAWQLRTLGIGSTTTARWRQSGYLHRVLPGVYAVGHRAPSTEAELAAALLYAGPGAMLSHRTAAWWYGLLDPEPPSVIDVAVPGRRRSKQRIRVHARTSADRTWRRGLPVTPIDRTLRDLAAVTSTGTLRWALANADYHRLLTPAGARSQLGRGRPGSAALTRAIRIHEPRLARTRSGLERAFIALIERYRLPMPEINHPLEGVTVDAFWPGHKIVVELDGAGNHSTPAQIEYDRRRDLRLRAAGYIVVRYTWEQLTTEAALVAADIRRMLSV